MKPTIGRIVHHYGDNVNQGPRAAIITSVNGDKTGMMIFTPLGATEVGQFSFSENPEPNTWTWPPRA